MKLWLMVFGLLFLPACATAAPAGSAPMPADIQAQVDGMQAGGQVSAAQTLVARGQATVFVITAQAQASRVAAESTSVYQTDVAAEKTADVRRSATADYKAQVAKTEAAGVRATDDMKTATYQTAAASARREQATAGAQAAETAQAHAQETATWIAAAPTRVAVANIQANEQAQMKYDREFADAYRTQALELAPALGAIRAVLDQLTLPVFLIALGLALLFGLVRTLAAATSYLRAHAAYREAEAVQKRLAMSSDGTVVGIIVKQGRDLVIRPPEPVMLEAPKSETRDVPLLDAPAQEVKTVETHAYNTLIGGFHYTSLLAFTRSILETGNWTQAKWCADDVVLPRGFKLTTDGYDSQGNFVEGTYSRLLRLFTEHNLILGRKHGASGRWNPNAPTEVEAVMGILMDKLPMPALPAEPVPVKRSRRKTKLTPVVN